MDIEIKKRNPRLRKYLLPALGGALILALAVWGVARSATTSRSVNARAMTTGTVTRGEFRDYLRLGGKVETGTVVQVSALESGVVEQKWVEEGAMVSPGDIILTLHNPNLRQQILDSESQLAEKQNMLRDTELAMEKDRLDVRRQLLTASTELGRKRRAMEQQKALFDENLTSREQYLQAREDYDLALQSYDLLRDRLKQDSAYRATQIGMMRESLRNMQENFALVRSRADNLNLRASHAGQLGNLSAEIGQNISAGQQVGQINILDRYKISVELDEHYIDRVAIGLTGSVTRSGKTYPVEVSKVYPEVTGGKFRADLLFSGDLPENIRVGQTYHIDLELGDAATTLMVPRGSFYQTSAGKYVYVIDPDGGTARRRTVRLGRQNPDYYEVVEGLEPGESIITSSYADFGEADILKINK